MLSHHHLMPQHHDEEFEEQDASAPQLSLAQTYARAIRAELALLSVESRQRFCLAWLERLTPGHPAEQMRDELMRVSELVS